MNSIDNLKVGHFEEIYQTLSTLNNRESVSSEYPNTKKELKMRQAYVAWRLLRNLSALRQRRSLIKRAKASLPSGQATRKLGGRQLRNLPAEYFLTKFEVFG